ncbi:MAG: hypothetical protein RR614_13110, partial [Eubacterium sp.]
MEQKKKNRAKIQIECIEKIEDFCVLVADKEGKIVAFSKGCERIEDIKREDALGRNPNDIYYPN